MAHLARAWRTSRTIWLFVLLTLLGTLVPHGTPQTKMIGSERLVSVDPLPEMGGEICEPVPASGPGGREEILVAALQERQEP